MDLHESTKVAKGATKVPVQSAERKDMEVHETEGTHDGSKVAEWLRKIPVKSVKRKHAEVHGSGLMFVVNIHVRIIHVLFGIDKLCASVPQREVLAKQENHPGHVFPPPECACVVPIVLWEDYLACLPRRQSLRCNSDPKVQTFKAPSPQTRGERRSNGTNDGTCLEGATGQIPPWEQDHQADVEPNAGGPPLPDQMRAQNMADLPTVDDKGWIDCTVLDFHLTSIWHEMHGNAPCRFITVLRDTHHHLLVRPEAWNGPEHWKIIAALHFWDAGNTDDVSCCMISFKDYMHFQTDPPLHWEFMELGDDSIYEMQNGGDHAQDDRLLRSLTLARISCRDCHAFGSQHPAAQERKKKWGGEDDHQEEKGDVEEEEEEMPEEEESLCNPDRVKTLLSLIKGHKILRGSRLL
ncbi:hypothetical protein OG21DRAFT_1526144 [Imleria badia]|nr:hypothetical protein OG21DRAFT_1526144 [Imleria badia]